MTVLACVRQSLDRKASANFPGETLEFCCPHEEAAHGDVDTLGDRQASALFSAEALEVTPHTAIEDKVVLNADGGLTPSEAEADGPWYKPEWLWDDTTLGQLLHYEISVQISLQRIQCLYCPSVVIHLLLQEQGIFFLAPILLWVSKPRYAINSIFCASVCEVQHPRC